MRVAGGGGQLGNAVATSFIRPSSWQTGQGAADGAAFTAALGCGCWRAGTRRSGRRRPTSRAAGAELRAELAATREWLVEFARSLGEVSEAASLLPKDATGQRI